MRRVLAVLLVVASMLLYGAATPWAGRPAETEEMLRHSTLGEIVVFEVDNCGYCPIFRRDVLPSYLASPDSRLMPLRFLDVNDARADGLGLDGPVNMVPTIVVLHANREVARIAGYWGPEHFFSVVRSHLPPRD